MVQLVNLLLILCGLGLMVVHSVWVPTVSELVSVGAFMIGLGMKRFGDISPTKAPPAPPGGEER